MFQTHFPHLQTQEPGSSSTYTASIPSKKTTEVYFDNLLVLKKISQAKFSVYLVAYPHTQQLYAMKIYPRELNHPNFFFLNEIRFGNLQHSNVVSILGWEHNKHVFKKGEVFRLSYMIMEFAPHGDLFDLFMRQKHHFEEKLVRTHFHQILDGLEFLHANGMAHLDLKLENLLVGEDYQLKITDFDLSFKEGDEKIHALGSQCYRAPEILRRTCVDPKAADIYSLAVILFMLQSQGVLPHLESQSYQGINLFEILGTNPELFWKKHCEFHRERAMLYTEEFRELFIGMTKNDPKERLTIEEIKSSKWYAGETYSPKELIEKMKDIII